MEHSIHVFVTLGFFPPLLTIDSSTPTSFKVLLNIDFNECVALYDAESKGYKPDDCGPQICFVGSLIHIIFKRLLNALQRDGTIFFKF